MSVAAWVDQLRSQPEQAVADLLGGAASISPFERAQPHEFLLALLPRSNRRVQARLLGDEFMGIADSVDIKGTLQSQLDEGLKAWLLQQRQQALPKARKLSSYAAQVSEALQWPVFFDLPQTVAALQVERARWLPWLQTLCISAYRDPEYDYWQLLATAQTDDALQFFWQSFVVEALHTRSQRYLDLGLLALAQMPLNDSDSLRNLRLQVQGLVNRYTRRKGLGAHALEELAEKLQSVWARNLSMGAENYRAFLGALLQPLGDAKKASVFALLGLKQSDPHSSAGLAKRPYKLEPPGTKTEADQAVQAIHDSSSLAQAWTHVRPLIGAHEDYFRKSGDAYAFVRAMDICARALCNKYELRDPEIKDRLFHWIQLSLQADADNPRRWMLWELTLRKAGYPQRAQWVLWEMTRRFPEQLPCRVELARLLAESSDAAEQKQAHRLLGEVLRMDPQNLHAFSTLAQMATHAGDYPQALDLTNRALRIDPCDGSSAVLRAQAYARRNESGDLDLAIESLQHFLSRNRVQPTAEGYLQKLIARKTSRAATAQFVDQPQSTVHRGEIVAPETDHAWLAFAQSVSLDAIGAAGGDGVPTDRAIPGLVLPLPLALKQELATDNWDAEVLQAYDEQQTREYPLETRLWNYLVALQSPTCSATNRRQRAQSLREWVNTQTQNQTDNPAYKHYLELHLADLVATETSGVENAKSFGTNVLAKGKAWLLALLDSHRALPAPLMV